MADTNFSSGTVIASTWLDDVNTSTYAQLTSVAGTNAITATGPLSMSAYAVGQRFFFIPAANNTGAVTINISGLGVVPITKFGFTSLVAQDLLVGVIAEMAYDGTEFQLINPQTFNLTNVVPITNGGTGATTASQALINLGATGRLIGMQTITATGIYIPTAGTTQILARLWGAGGAGGGSVATGAATISVGAGGGAGGYVEGIITAGFSGQTVTIGAAGAAAVGAAGGAGGTSTFMTFSATGGAGGAASAAGGVTAAAGGLGGTGSGGSFGNVGEAGDLVAAANVQTIWLSGEGGNSVVGAGGGRQQASGTAGTAGVSASGRAAGGGGGVSGNSFGALGGGFGTDGLCVIYEYS